MMSCVCSVSAYISHLQYAKLQIQTRSCFRKSSGSEWALKSLNTYRTFPLCTSSPFITHRPGAAANPNVFKIQWYKIVFCIRHKISKVSNLTLVLHSWLGDSVQTVCLVSWYNVLGMSTYYHYYQSSFISIVAQHMLTFSYSLIMATSSMLTHHITACLNLLPRSRQCVQAHQPPLSPDQNPTEHLLRCGRMGDSEHKYAANRCAAQCRSPSHRAEVKKVID